jgi:SCY1-like protein 2
MTEKLTPLLKNIKTKEPSVTMASLEVYAEMGKKLGHDVVASDILPALWPMAVVVLLDFEQVAPSDDINPVQPAVECDSRARE